MSEKYIVSEQGVYDLYKQRISFTIEKYIVDI